MLCILQPPAIFCVFFGTVIIAVMNSYYSFQIIADTHLLTYFLSINVIFILFCMFLHKLQLCSLIVNIDPDNQIIGFS